MLKGPFPRVNIFSKKKDMKGRTETFGVKKVPESHIGVSGRRSAGGFQDAFSRDAETPIRRYGRYQKCAQLHEGQWDEPGVFRI
jgi:hypothetical protein